MKPLINIFWAVSFFWGSQTVVAQEDAIAASVMSCEYECKSSGAFTLLEASTVVIANEHADSDGQHAVTHRAHLVFLDGNENPIFRSYVDLSGNDLDEVQCMPFCYSPASWR